MSEIIVPRQFRGPPVTANGGYICGVLSNAVGGRGSAMLRSGVPLDVAVTLTPSEDGGVVLSNAEGQPLGSAKPAADDAIPMPPSPHRGRGQALRGGVALRRKVPAPRLLLLLHRA
uniref:Uncharacterized protein n=1 Tax=Phenylobacterium glaciei TaxID=2803784 RepID=A0A974P6I2_9CAUL|nr:hypothetical protein JKL49_09345 [Phenylobacterium glaciei]